MSTPSPSNLPNEQATPRTDAFRNTIHTTDVVRNPFQVVNDCIAFAKKLELDLTAAQAQIAKLTEERDALAKKQPINTHRRLFDLVRYMRAELHDQDLINTEEYAWLCEYTFKDDPQTGSPSPRRLEDYDTLRAQVADLTRSLEAKQGHTEDLVREALDRGFALGVSYEATNQKDPFNLEALFCKFMQENCTGNAQPAQSTAQGTEGKP